MSACHFTRRSRDPRSQSGFTLFGLLVWAVFISFMGLMAMRIWPSLNEYITIQQSVTRIMKADPRPTSPVDIRKAFDHQREVEYSITTLKGADLEIETVNEQLRTTFAYDKEIEIFGPVYLLIKYRGGAGG
jgi:uncharacterized membrane protein YhiD involved in acid resistance